MTVSEPDGSNFVVIFDLFILGNGEDLGDLIEIKVRDSELSLVSLRTRY